MTKSSGADLSGSSISLGPKCQARKYALMAAVALSLLTSSLAFADPPGDHGHDRDHHEWRHGDHDRDHHEWRHDDHDRREHRDEWRYQHEDRHAYRFDSGEYFRPHGYYVHRWHRGDRLPIDYRAPVYVVPNVAVYRLRPPPPGYYWVRVDNNAVLAAVATGVVIDVAYNLFH
jgi:Ni/Co efflux regulator RcnB